MGRRDGRRGHYRECRRYWIRIQREILERERERGREEFTNDGVVELPVAVMECLVEVDN